MSNAFSYQQNMLQQMQQQQQNGFLQMPSPVHGMGMKNSFLHSEAEGRMCQQTGVGGHALQQMRVDGQQVMAFQVQAGNHNIVNAAAIPCNGGYAIPMVPCNGGFAIAALPCNGQGGSDNGTGAGNNPMTDDEYDDMIDGINDIDLSIRCRRESGNQRQQMSSPLSRSTDSTFLHTQDSSRQLSGVSSCSGHSGQPYLNLGQVPSGDLPNYAGGVQQFGLHPQQRPQMFPLQMHGMRMSLQQMQQQNMSNGQWQGSDQSPMGSPHSPMDSDQAGFRQTRSPGVQMPQTADTGSTPEGTNGLMEAEGDARRRQELGRYMMQKIFNQPLKTTASRGSNEKGANQKTRKEKSVKQRAVDPMSWDGGVVTVMIRQIPRQLSQLSLLKEVNERGFKGLFDFLYLPFDLKKGINVGYGFVSFLEPKHALIFREEFDGTFLDTQSSLRGKPLHVHPAAVQGYHDNYAHFATTKTGQKQDPQFSPLFFPEGHPVDAAMAGLLGGGLFAAHQAAMVAEEGFEDEDDTLKDEVKVASGRALKSNGYKKHDAKASRYPHAGR